MRRGNKRKRRSWGARRGNEEEWGGEEVRTCRAGEKYQGEEVERDGRVKYLLSIIYTNSDKTNQSVNLSCPYGWQGNNWM